MQMGGGDIGETGERCKDGSSATVLYMFGFDPKLMWQRFLYDGNQFHPKKLERGTMGVSDLVRWRTVMWSSVMFVLWSA